MNAKLVPRAAQRVESVESVESVEDPDAIATGKHQNARSKACHSMIF